MSDGKVHHGRRRSKEMRGRETNCPAKVGGRGKMLRTPEEDS